ncbi:MAG TPA: AI-2E family transporter [Alphaproteobacteria bacterium]
MATVQISTQTKTVFWALVIAAFVGFVLLFQNILAPFVLGIVIAYLLNPIVIRVAHFGMPRWAVVLGILALFMGLVVLIIAMIVPVLIREIVQMSDDLPTWITSAQITMVEFANKFGLAIDPAEIAGNLQGQAGQILKAGKGLLAGLMAGGVAIASFITFVFLMPIVAFYMMVDWPRLTSKVDELLPKNRAATIHDLLGQIDRTLAGFIRGQLSVCLILGLMYGVGLSLIGLKFGFLIGMTAGILSIMPYVGSAIGLVLSTGVAWFTTHDWGLVGMAIIVFVVGQIVEGNFLTPKLVGGNVGLHPLWIIFALMAGGALAGFVGLLIAVPVAAVIGVMVRFALGEYKKSEYYTK